MSTNTTAPADRMITISVAEQIAQQRGTPVKGNTILVAARRGSIQGTARRGKFWVFPAWAFEDWLSVHTSRADYDPRATEGD